jgi:hypothetical protein
MEEWELFAERLTLVILIALSRVCYRIAEWCGRMGIHFEYRYRQLVSP